MSKIFVKSGDLKINGIYLVANDKPVYHKEFVDAQKQAEYIVKFAELAKTKDFKGKKADSLTELKAEVNKVLGNKETVYLTTVKPVKGELTTKLANEALVWLAATTDLSKVEKINSFLQQFNIIKKFEEIGLYFDESEIVELNKIYTIKEIIEAVKSVIDILD